MTESNMTYIHPFENLSWGKPESMSYFIQAMNYPHVVKAKNIYRQLRNGKTACSSV